MPPPKKPKTGASRVAEFLSQSELDELSSRTSSSPHSLEDSEGSPYPRSPNQEMCQQGQGDGNSYRNSTENIQQTNMFSRMGAAQNSSIDNDSSRLTDGSAMFKVLESQKTVEKSPLFRRLFMQEQDKFANSDEAPSQKVVRREGKEKKPLVHSLLMAEEFKPSTTDSEAGSLLQRLMKKDSPSFSHLATGPQVRKERNSEERKDIYGGALFAKNKLANSLEAFEGRGHYCDSKPKKAEDLHIQFGNVTNTKECISKDKFVDGERQSTYSSMPLVEKVETEPLNLRRNNQFLPYGSHGEANLQKPSPRTIEIPGGIEYEARPGGPSSRKEHTFLPSVGREEFNQSRKNFVHFSTPQSRMTSDGQPEPTMSQAMPPTGRFESSEVGNNGTSPVFSKAYMNAVSCMAAMSSGRPEVSPSAVPLQPALSVSGSPSAPNPSSPDFVARHLNRAQQEYLRRLPPALQQEALKNPNSAATVAAFTATRGDPNLGKNIGLDLSLQQHMTPSGESTRNSPVSHQPLPSSGQSRNQINTTHQDKEVGEYIPRPMEQSPSVVSSASAAQHPLAGREPAGFGQMASGQDEQQRGGGDNPVGSSNVTSSPAPLNSPQEMPSSTMDDRRGRARSMAVEEAKAGGRRCQICDDTASGFHYGVWSCEGCKAFFKRSLQGPVDYVCPATNNCTIDKHRRKSCQACRLRKCLEAGMSRGNCRKEKGPRGPNKQKRKAESVDCSETFLKETKVKKEAAEDTFSQYGDQSVNGFSGVSQEASPVESQPRPSPERDSPHPIHPFVEHLMRIDPPVRFANHDSQTSDSQLHLLTSLLKLADTELVDIINWAKAIPGYNDLTLDDRIHLLESSWMELLMLGLLWRSMPYTDTLVFAPDLPMDRERCKVADVQATCDKLFAMVDRFRELKINREELVLIRITLLLNAEMVALHSNNSIKRILEMVNEAWHYTLVTRHKHSPLRLTQIMLMLPHFRQCSLGAVAYIFELKRTSSVPIYDLLREMLEGQREVLWNPPTTSAGHSNANPTGQFGLQQSNNANYSDISASNPNHNTR